MHKINSEVCPTFFTFVCCLIFLAKCFITVCFRFLCMYFLTIRMALIKKQFHKNLIFLKLFPATLPCLNSGWKKLFFLKERVAGREELQGRASRKSGRAGQLNGWVPLVHLDCYHFKSRWNSSSTLSKRQIIEKFNVKKEKEVLLAFIISLFCK